MNGSLTHHPGCTLGTNLSDGPHDGLWETPTRKDRPTSFVNRLQGFHFLGQVTGPGRGTLPPLFPHQQRQHNEHTINQNNTNILPCEQSQLVDHLWKDSDLRITQTCRE
jgi:hypothetical protein